MDVREEGIHAEAGAHVQCVRHELHERTMSILAMVFASVAIVMAGVAWYQTSIAEREARLLQYYVLEMDAKLISSGVKKPDDSVASKLKEK